MQGIAAMIPTNNKIRYINQLLKVGFDTIDFGSFVSPKAVPQMADTADVLRGLDLATTQSKLLAIVANVRGCEDAIAFESIDYLGYPLSISETFQQRNTRASIVESLNTVEQLQEMCQQYGKQLVVYLSMGFGNPYGDPYSEEIVSQFSGILTALEVKVISLADTIGTASVEQIGRLFTFITRQYPDIEFGVHLHSNPKEASEKIKAAYEAGCRRFDGAIKGFGGCPFAKDDLVGNIPTEAIVQTIEEFETLTIDREELSKSMQFADSVFP